MGAETTRALSCHIAFSTQDFIELWINRYYQAPHGGNGYKNADYSHVHTNRLDSQRLDDSCDFQAINALFSSSISPHYHEHVLYRRDSKIAGLLESETAGASRIRAGNLLERKLQAFHAV
jgi:hypothetical protein